MNPTEKEVGSGADPIDALPAGYHPYENVPVIYTEYMDTGEKYIKGSTNASFVFCIA
jgi:hypothetical protein